VRRPAAGHIEHLI